MVGFVRPQMYKSPHQTVKHAPISMKVMQNNIFSCSVTKSRKLCYFNVAACSWVVGFLFLLEELDLMQVNRTPIFKSYQFHIVCCWVCWFEGTSLSLCNRILVTKLFHMQWKSLSYIIRESGIREERNVCYDGQCITIWQIIKGRNPGVCRMKQPIYPVKAFILSPPVRTPAHQPNEHPELRNYYTPCEPFLSAGLPIWS